MLLDKNPEGILIVDKQKGMTSHDAVDLVRKRFRIKKVGHAGTLDPNATGVLVLLIGRSATKLSGKLLSEDKEYVATMKLGVRTDSADSDGAALETKEVNSSEGDIERAVLSFAGEIEQIPPMVSAKKVKGRKLYELAREGLEVKREPVRVTIREIEIVKIEKPFVEFRVVCTKGTYIRQLAEDIGAILGCGAHLTELTRTRSGSFTISDAVDVDVLRTMKKEELNETLIRLP